MYPETINQLRKLTMKENRIRKDLQSNATKDVDAQIRRESNNISADS